MNFSDIYKKIRSIDEAGPVVGASTNPAVQQSVQDATGGQFVAKTAPPAPAAPSPYGGPPKTHGPIVLGQQPTQPQATNPAPAAQAAPTGAIDYKKPGPITQDSTGQKLEYGIPVNAQGAFMEPNIDATDEEYAQQRAAYKPWKADFMKRYPNAKQQPDTSYKNETGLENIPTGLAPMPMESYRNQSLNECGDMPQPPQQQDVVDMNVTLHGSGPGGIRSLMSILRDIEGKDSNGGMTVEPHADDIEVMLGDMEEEYGNSAHGASGPHTASIQDVTNVGTPTNGGDHKPRQAGLPQANAHAMHETVKSRLQQHYSAIKEAGVAADLARSASNGLSGMADTKLGDIPGNIANGAKQMYNNAATAVGNAATAVGNTTPRQIGQGINNAVNDASNAVRNFARFPGLAPQPGGTAPFNPRAAGQPATPAQAVATQPRAAGLITATGNVTGGNIRTTGQPATPAQAVATQPRAAGQPATPAPADNKPADNKPATTTQPDAGPDHAPAEGQPDQAVGTRESIEFDRFKELNSKLNKTHKLKEGCLQDPHKHALAHILMADRHGHNQLATTGVASPDLYENLYDYYFDDMPKHIKKHPDHQVRHDHVASRCKVDMMTPECVQAMSGTNMMAPQSVM